MNLFNLAPFLAELSSILDRNITKPFYFLNYSMFFNTNLELKEL